MYVYADAQEEYTYTLDKYNYVYQLVQLTIASFYQKITC